MKAAHPRVSIVIPVYNGSNFLREAVDSALAQTYDNIEIIVINDGSNDNGATEKIAKSYGNKVRYYRKENGGVATALNLGIKKMTGEYFSWLSHDDLYHKDKIKEQVMLLERQGYDDVIVACNDKALFDSGLTRNQNIDKQLFEYFDLFLAIANDVGVNGCSLLIPKKALIESKGFNPKLQVTQDYDLWYRLSSKYRFTLLEKNLVTYRRHSRQDSVTKRAESLMEGDRLRSAILGQISYQRFEEYLKKSSMQKIWKKYLIYKNAGQVRTASELLRNILEYYKRHKPKNYEKIARIEMAELDDISNNIERIIQQNLENTKTPNSKVGLILASIKGEGVSFTLRKIMNKIFRKITGS